MRARGPVPAGRLVSAGVLALAGALLLGGCGVPVDAEPRNADGPGGPLPSAPPLVLDQGGATMRLCFVHESRLLRVPRRVPVPATAQEQLRALLDGPSATEAEDGLTSALTGTTTSVELTLAGGRATVDVGDRSGHGVRTDEILAFGQIVCTLSARPEVGTIRFTSRGAPLEVPTQDGSLASEALTVADYDGLIDS